MKTTFEGNLEEIRDAFNHINVHHTWILKVSYEVISREARDK